LSRSIFFISDFSDGDGGTSFANTSSSVIPDDSPFSSSLLNDVDIIDCDETVLDLHIALVGSPP
jgi:hypothetical protein